MMNQAITASNCRYRFKGKTHVLGEMGNGIIANVEPKSFLGFRLIWACLVEEDRSLNEGKQISRNDSGILRCTYITRKYSIPK